MREIHFYLVSFFLLPVLFWQGRKARKRIPRLPEASGPDFKEWSGSNRIRLLAIGESTVAGVGIPTYPDSLTGQVASVLGKKTGRRISWKAMGKSGITAREAVQKFGSQLPPRAPDVLVLALGANDVMNLSSRRSWISDLEGMIEVCRNSYPETPIFIAGVPPLGIFPALPWALRFILGWKAVLLDKASGTLSSGLQNVFHIPMRKIRSIPLEGFFCSDGFHPSIKGCSLWGEEIAESIHSVLQRKISV
ncbi:GDSL family lipase [Leptospira wolffii]|uniref:GDSL family lipase n=1 Tax=Leptospira wolffii TaxID=409998 RepID=A0A2M9ZCC1_9LEPT|nr:SGNH/GDSL hydrolase family protein [Leptospira wolffii]PJZ66048.1 GDSL family lipase [Leptospira wolffii]